MLTNFPLNIPLWEVEWEACEKLSRTRLARSASKLLSVLPDNIALDNKGGNVATALSLAEIRRRCAKVVADWTEEPGEQAQSFIKDLLGACLLNWSETGPTIFSSLFQSAESAKARRQLGEHYTTEINILKTLSLIHI